MPKAKGSSAAQKTMPILMLASTVFCVVNAS